ncbi:MAG TPA: hypothetical protein VHV80_10720 [Steroidobacteraceae bacterium]|nr:hypothetical protein [Steroidobacteraceae bacterium]
MSGEMVLLRVVDEAREGWKWMPFEEFLERINLASWQDGQELVGMVLPEVRLRRTGADAISPPREEPVLLRPELDPIWAMRQGGR